MPPYLLLQYYAHYKSVTKPFHLGQWQPYNLHRRFRVPFSGGRDARPR